MANFKYPNTKARKRAQYKAIRKFQRKKMTAFTFKFHNDNDKAVIDKLKSVNNKQDYIRQLILEDIRLG